MMLCRRGSSLHGNNATKIEACLFHIPTFEMDNAAFAKAFRLELKSLTEFIERITLVQSERLRIRLGPSANPFSPTIFRSINLHASSQKGKKCRLGLTSVKPILQWFLYATLEDIIECGPSSVLLSHGEYFKNCENVMRWMVRVVNAHAAFIDSCRASEASELEADAIGTLASKFSFRFSELLKGRFGADHVVLTSKWLSVFTDFLILVFSKLMILGQFKTDHDAKAPSTVTPKLFSAVIADVDMLVPESNIDDWFANMCSLVPPPKPKVEEPFPYTTEQLAKTIEESWIGNASSSSSTVHSPPNVSLQPMQPRVDV